MPAAPERRTLITGATGFVGGALVLALAGRGQQVIAASRGSGQAHAGVEWRSFDLLRPDTHPAALAGARVAYYLAHSMGGGHADFRALERRAAEAFVSSAAEAGIERIIYLGGPQPLGPPSEHLRSRLEVGEILRAGPIPTVELRASMVIGNGSASWQIVRDLAMRLPVMVLPKWLRSRTRPVALPDVIAALTGAARLPLERSAWFDFPGPEILSGRQDPRAHRRPAWAAHPGRRRPPAHSAAVGPLAEAGHPNGLHAGAGAGGGTGRGPPSEGRALLAAHRSHATRVVRRRCPSRSGRRAAPPRCRGALRPGRGKARGPHGSAEAS